MDFRIVSGLLLPHSGSCREWSSNHEARASVVSTVNLWASPEEEEYFQHRDCIVE